MSSEHDTTPLARRCERLADDLLIIASESPALDAPAQVVTLYGKLREAVAERTGEAPLFAVPRFGAGGGGSYGELALFAGQLAEVSSTHAVG
jgi:hypothetical protein